MSKTRPKTEAVNVHKNVLFLLSDLSNLGDALIAFASLDVAKSVLGASQISIAVPTLPAQPVHSFMTSQGADMIIIPSQLRALFAACATSDMFIGGGQMIRESISGKWLLLLLATTSLARLQGRRVHMVGAGATRIKNPWKRKLWAAVLLNCHSVRMRDHESSRLVTSALSKAIRATTTGDIVFALTGRLTAHAGRSEAAYCVLSPAHDPSEGRSADYGVLVSLLVGLRDAGLFEQLWIVPHDLRHGLDHTLCLDLKQRLLDDGRVPVRIVVCDSPDELIQVYQGSSLVVTARLHGLIAAALSRRPAVIVDGTAKLRPFAALFGYAELTAGNGDDMKSAVENAIESVRTFSPESCKAQLDRQRVAALANFEF